VAHGVAMEPAAFTGARTAAGLSQAEVAQKLGLTQTAYANWERYPVALRPEQIEKLIAILKVAVEQLFADGGRCQERGGPVGRARRAFERISKLPRSRQQRTLAVVEDLLTAAQQVATQKEHARKEE